MVTEGVIKHVEDIDVILEGLDENNISSILTKWKEVNEVKRKLEQLDEMLKIKIKNYLKERKWNNFNDKETKINVTLTSQKMENIDKAQLKLILTDSQMSQVIKTTIFEKLLIVSAESRERMKKFVVTKKIK